MKLGYTEFSFGYAFTENLIRSSANAPIGAPQFPNLVQEATLGYDVRIDLPACPFFFQFKLPELMVRDTAKEIAVHQLSGIACNFFRMPLMKRSLSDQHRHLISLEQRYPGKVFYASPRMPSVQTFNVAYNQASVHTSSVLFSPIDIGPLPDDRTHVVSYSADGNAAWRCSAPKKVTPLGFDKIFGIAAEAFSSTQFSSVEAVADQMVKELLEVVPRVARIDAAAFRDRARARIASVSPVDGIGDRHLRLAEQLLVGREIARIGLGIEMVIAQPQA